MFEHTRVYTDAPDTPSMLGGAASRACLRSIIAVPPPLPAASCKSSDIAMAFFGRTCYALGQERAGQAVFESGFECLKTQVRWMLLSIPLTSPPRQSHLDTRLQRARGHGAQGA